MIIRHVAHSCFRLELENGLNIVLDPYDASTGYPVQKIAADVVLISHHHHDHNAVENVCGADKVIDKPGKSFLEGNISVTGFPTYHDEVKGRKRGNNTMFAVDCEGLRILHMGDIGHMLDADTFRQIGHVDVLLIPVGGFFTIDAVQATKIVEQIDPAIVIPMHYKTAANSDWPIAGVEDFIAETGRKFHNFPFIRITSQDVSCQPKYVLLAETCFEKTEKKSKL